MEKEIKEPQEKPPTSKPYQWQLKNRITTFEKLSKQIELDQDEIDAEDLNLPLNITPYYLNLIKTYPDSPLRKTMIPTKYESVF